MILQALVGRDGLIQNVRVISGPPILASAAQEAVKQWHFKPHYEGSEAVETQAKITVNFVISTNWMVRAGTETIVRADTSNEKSSRGSYVRRGSSCESALGGASFQSCGGFYGVHHIKSEFHERR